MNTRTFIITFVWMIMSNIGICAQEHWDVQEKIELNKDVFPKNFSKAIDAIQYDLLQELEMKPTDPTPPPRQSASLIRRI